MIQNKFKFSSSTAVILPLDILMINAIYFLMMFFYGNFHMSYTVALQMSIRIPLVTLIYIGIYALSRIYNIIWRYASLYDVLRFGIATVISTFFTWLFDFLGMWVCIALMKVGYVHAIYIKPLPFSVYLDSTLMILGVCLFFRIIRRSVKVISSEGIRHGKSSKKPQKKILIVGAGTVGSALVNELQMTDYRLGIPIGILDDDPKKYGLSVVGTPVIGSCDDAAKFVQKYDVDTIYFCITQIDEIRKREILETLVNTGCTVKMASDHEEVSQGKSTIKEARNVDILDLLSRPQIELNHDVCHYLKDEVVLVTGGGGSIGSELCRQIARYHPKEIVIFDIYENNAYALKNSLDLKYFGVPKIEIRIGSVREERRLREVFEEFHPTSVFHAAAHKHVPLMEDSPYEALKNNILGTYNTAKVANEYGVKNFVLLSTDKAVNPTNVMGASKRCCELVVQHFSKISQNTKFAAVRFGNVLGSNGSVIPLFKEQLENGGPLTVTHPDITRYFMTIPEAAQLVVQAGGLAKGGEIFVLDMGEPVKIITLAEKLIKLSGFEPYVDIDIQFTGLRPGEKLYEELILPSEKDGMHKTQNDKIFVTAPYDFDEKFFMEQLKKIETLNPAEAKDFLKTLVPNFHPTEL